MKALIFNPEQYVDWELEPSNYQLRLPLLNSGAITEHRDYVYQRVLKNDGRDAMNRRALDEFREFKPDVVINSLTWWRECLDWQTLRDIRAEGGVVLTVFWDTWPDSLPHEIELTLNSDAILVMDSLTNYYKLRLLAELQGRIDTVAFAPIAVFTDLVRPADVMKSHDVLMLGSHEGRRIELTRFLESGLAEKGIAFTRLGGLIDEEDEGDGKSDNWIGWEDYVAAINSTKIGLSSQTQSDRLQIKGKIFDYFACGVFCLADENPELREIVPADCLVYYDNEADCLEKILYFLDHDGEREAIAGRAHAWFNDTYDYKTFWQGMIARLTGKAAEFPALSGVEPGYARYKSNLDLVTRASLFALDHLGRAVVGGKQTRRLPVRAEGVYQGLNILTIDDRYTVACDGVLIDFIEIDGALFAVAPGAGLIELPKGAVHQTGLFRLIRAESVAHAQNVLDMIGGKSKSG